MNRFSWRFFATLLLLLFSAFLSPLQTSHQAQQSNVVKGKAAQIVIGKSTWKDVESIFGKGYLIKEPTTRERRQKVWLMVYPKPPDYRRAVFFIVNRKTGIVEGRSSGTVQERYFGEREPDSVRRLVTEFGAPYCSKDEPWGEAKYKGIVVGKSKRVDVERTFGSGDSVHKCDSAERKFAVVEYAKLPEFQGRVSFGLECRTNVVEYVTLEPSQPWPLEKAVATYGPGYCYRRYRLTAELEDLSEYGPGKEHPRGNVVEVAYPSIGMVLALDSSGRIYLIICQKGPNRGTF